MMILYHLHNPTAPVFVTTCNACHLDIEAGQGWRCETCPDYDVCNACYQRDGGINHPHKLTNHPSIADHDAQNKEARQVLQMSGSRMKVAGRFKPCVHMGCFDLDVFVEMNQRSRKWQCLICLKNYSLENIIIDPYFNRITSKMRSCGEDVTEIEVKLDGSWHVKAKNDRRGLGDITHWHFPDGTLCVRTDGEAISKADTIKQVK